ncbi:hypothetical protein [uncultured Serinicoccus sp.]|uniref:hypothetical protein n=1 Tax=uncultured Serinicoccus sp. TaxID=735514 RepID=UPI0026289844|nr:hypothetical protein [uncultured Serinicoccus sp.]
MNRALIEQPQLIVNHLHIAKALDGWATRMEENATEAGSDEQFDKGYAKALREVSAHLRQCDYLPGGAMIEESEDDGPPPLAFGV